MVLLTLKTGTYVGKQTHMHAHTQTLLWKQSYMYPVKKKKQQHFFDCETLKPKRNLIYSVQLYIIWK